MIADWPVEHLEDLMIRPQKWQMSLKAGTKQAKQAKQGSLFGVLGLEPPEPLPAWLAVAILRWSHPAMI